ncbi:MAG: two-component regulator propeller domain-containing protein [Bacteroidia bacterium]
MIWAGSYNGLTSIDMKNNQVKAYYANQADPQSLSSNNIRAICEDEKGNLFIGTYGGGLCVMQKDNGVFKTYRKGDKNSISSNIITSLYYDGHGNLYVGTRWRPLHNEHFIWKLFNL